MNSLSDQELVARIQNGNTADFGELYQRYYTKAQKAVSAVIKNADLVEELTQEALFQAFKSIQNFRGNSSFYTWIFRIARNIALNQIRKEKRRANDVPIEQVPEIYFQEKRKEEDPLTHTERREHYEEIKKAINNLPPNQRTAMVLGPLQGYSHKKTGSLLGVDANTIKTRLHRARENIRAQIFGKLSTEKKYRTKYAKKRSPKLSCSKPEPDVHS